MTETAGLIQPADFGAYVAQDQFSIPDHSTKVFKDECVYCFHTPFFPDGLFICLKTFCCFCKRHASCYAEKTGNILFVQLESQKVAIENEADDGEPKDKITKLAIGMDSGFDTQKYEYHDNYWIVMFPDYSKRCPVVKEVGDSLYEVANFVATSTSAERLEMLQNASNAWDGELKQVTKHADIMQLPNNKKLPPTGWKCEEGGCDLGENLWLNLTDGAIRCGRSQFISEGQMSKGNNHMKQYYDATGYPLVVKLGTITKEGADVYSYDEDDAVIDPNLEKHLAHFGLNPAQLEKTEKSTLEMELDLNQKWEWAKCQEDGASLESIFGSGYTGLINIGSSCYMNSVLQALAVIPSFRRRYVEGVERILGELSPADVHNNFNAQVAKLFKALDSSDYSQEGSELNGIKPKQFKRVVAGHHYEFSTARQQDAEEYVRYLLDQISSNTPTEEIDPTLALKFKVETRFEDIGSGRVRYTDKEEVVLPLAVKQELLTEISSTEEGQRYNVSLLHLLESAFAPDMMEDYRSPMTGEVSGASNTIRFKTFPDFLLIQIQKFTLAADGTQKKLDMDLKVDDEIDLSELRGTGAKENEQLLPDDGVAPATSSASSIPDFDSNICSQLQQMGFSENASIKAAIEVYPNRGTAEAALEWLMQYMDDPSLNDPPQPRATTNSVAASDRPCVQQLIAFGFTAHQACFALEKYPDANQAAEWLFEHANEVPPEQPVNKNKVVNRNIPDGLGKYRLVGLISHMGSSPHSGHYVAHIFKNGKWILFNDEKVAVSQNPPKQLAYLYLYERICA